MPFEGVNFQDVFNAEVASASRGVSARGGDLIGADVQVIGLEEALRKIRLLGQNIVRASVVSSAKYAQLAFFTSLKHVPFDTGDLFESGNIKRSHDTAGHRYIYDISYNTYYAAQIHENPMGWEIHQGKGPFAGEPKMDHWLTHAVDVTKHEFPSLVRGEVTNHIQAAVSGQLASVGADAGLDIPGQREFSSWEDVLSNWSVD